MNKAKYDEALKAYQAGEYRVALKGFLDSIDRDSPYNGAACHMAGNCALRLRRNADAVTAYRRALLDETYDKQGAVRVNLGTALAAEGEFTAAAREFEAALDDPDYATRHKAYTGLGNAHLKAGKVKDAAFAFRSAAGERSNPDPGKALVNLGICFMALERPNDAVEAYRAALGIESYAGKGKALANLGQAYVAAGRMHEAHRAFEQAVERYSQQLSAAANRDWDAARAALGIASQPEAESVVVPVEAPAATAVLAPEPPFEAVVAAVERPVESVVASEPEIDLSKTGGIPVAVETGFFTATEEELRRRGREEVKEARRSSRLWLKVTVGFVLAVVLLAGATAGAYLLGYGWPTQEQTLEALVAAHAKGEDVDAYWVASPSVDVIRAMMAVPPSTALSVDSIDRGAVESTAIVTITLENDTPVRYEVTFSREGVGWKVADIETYFASRDAE